MQESDPVKWAVGVAEPGCCATARDDSAAHQTRIRTMCHRRGAASAGCEAGHFISVILFALGSRGCHRIVKARGGAG